MNTKPMRKQQFSQLFTISNGNSLWTKVTYNANWKRLRGSHFTMTFFVTQFFILAPSLSMQGAILIPGILNNSIALYLCLSLLHWITMTVSLVMLHKCSATEPGIIPCLQNIPRVPI